MTRADRILLARERRERAARSGLDGLTPEQKIAAAQARAANRADDQLPERMLPDTSPEVDLVTMTLPELHDLIYNATSTTLRESMTHLPMYARQREAERIASQALLIVRGQDYLHQGADPRG